VGGGVLAAPLGGDPAEVAARVFALRVVAHGCCVWCVYVCEGDARSVCDRTTGRSFRLTGWS
jgi:hypothetical protein